MNRWIITGCGTDVGKTIVSSILATVFKADYWKPIECGDLLNSDSQTVKKLSPSYVHPSAYRFKHSLSPHHAARLEDIAIDCSKIVIPHTNNPLIIETAGGLLVPLNKHTLTIDLFTSWNIPWIVISRHYVGSINHTLLTIEALQKRNLPIVGLIFNGEPNPDTEEAILYFSKLPFLGRVLPERKFTKTTIQRYAKKWQQLII